MEFPSPSRNPKLGLNLEAGPAWRGPPPAKGGEPADGPCGSCVPVYVDGGRLTSRGMWDPTLIQPLCKEKKSNSRPLPLPLTTTAENWPNQTGQGGGILEMETFLKASSSWSSRRSADALWRQECVCLGPCVGGWAGSTQLMPSCSPALCKAGPVLTVALQCHPTHPRPDPRSLSHSGRGSPGAFVSSPASPLPTLCPLSFHFSQLFSLCFSASVSSLQFSSNSNTRILAQTCSH